MHSRHHQPDLIYLTFYLTLKGPQRISGCWQGYLYDSLVPLGTPYNFRAKGR